MSSPDMSTDILDPVEAQLQQELRTMFEVDTQGYLQSYLDLSQRLQVGSWKADIQELYRYIHTIKGGAVTVRADAVLQVATVLEDLLSELRYLDTAPPLEDGHLAAMLLEAGELLASSVQIKALGPPATEAVQPSIQQIETLKQTIQTEYLGDWNEQVQLWQEFAEQGFDLVVLDLEMALEQLPSEGTTVATEVIETAQETLQQLGDIGQDLQFSPEWKRLLKRSQVLFDRLEPLFWQNTWPQYLNLLKTSAKRGGVIPEALKRRPQVTAAPSMPTPATAAPSMAAPTSAADPIPDVQIAVPLQRLDASAKDTVDTLLTVRTSQELFKSLQAQLRPLLLLAQESTYYITQLRQMQDDYALLNSLTDQEDTPATEQYRQGYLTINRLLENSLRLSEIGAEAEKTAQQTELTLQQLNKTIHRLQRTIESSRLVSFRTIGFKVRSILRDLTTRYHKPAQLIIRGETLELDAGTVQQLEPVLLHLIRNAFDHGLESPAERTDAGKLSQGTIQMTLQRRGNLYRLLVQDDGKGIDPDHIAQLAHQKGMPLTATQTPEQLLAVLCQPGFSSRSEVSDISGRGVGMDVVASQIQALDGQLSLRSVVGQGTLYTIEIPVPHLLVQCILIRVGSQTMAIPSDETASTSLLEVLDYQQITRGARKEWIIQTETVASVAIDLATLWLRTEARDGFTEDAVAICTHPGTPNEGSAWLIADELLGQSELLIQSIPHPLNPPAGLLGVSLQPDGRLIPVLDPIALITQSSLPVPQLPAITTLAPTVQPRAGRSILVVDDAALMRRRIEASLTSYGYSVSTCADGVEAWQWLQTQGHPDLLITDIEMPRMDGFTLIDQCRGAGLTLPILVISSRLSEEWSREARRVGATDYLTKGFSTQDLITLVRSLLDQ